MASSSSSSSPEISHLAPTFDPSFFSDASLDEVLEELSTRFIMNLPDQELESVERMCFQVEQAHWYYEDFMREANPKLPSFTLKRFSSIFFNSCPLLRQWSAEHEQYFNTFMQYKVRVPVCGAIMLNDKWDKCILVKGWKSSAGWSFPKGKINQNEPAHECAAREVAEETGFNISEYIRPKDCIEMTIREQRVTLFIVGGIPEDYPFHTRTRKEISKIDWFKLSDLPSWKRNKQVPGKFYLISPFVHALKEFIRVNKPTRRRQNRRKNVDDSSVDLSIQTNLNGDADVEHRQQTSIRAVSLERDVHGYSSSSVDNGEPQTPSPQSTEAVPVAAEVDTESNSDAPLDPHFARLLSGLTLSASKPELNKETELRSTSVTPTSAKSSLASATEKERNCSRPMDALDNEVRNVVSIPPIVAANSLSLLGTKSPVDSSRSDSSIVTIRPQSAQALPSGPAFPNTATDRHLKHLALLESVAQEAAVSTPVGAAPQLPHPGPPQSVPPMPFGLDGAALLPAGPVMHNVGMRPNVNGRPVTSIPVDPFAIRPVTSQALFPPPPSVRRHGPNVSMQQDYLLSILRGSNGQPANGQVPYHHTQPFGAAPIQAPVPFGAGSVQRSPFIPPTRTQTLVPQPLRVMPPPTCPVHLNSGPLTAPLPPPSAQPQSPFIQHGPNMPVNSYKPMQPNAAQLLSILNPNSTHTLVSDATRPNFSTGNSAAPPRL